MEKVVKEIKVGLAFKMILKLRAFSFFFLFFFLFIFFLNDDMYVNYRLAKAE